MTLSQLSVEYKNHAEQLHHRLKSVEEQRQSCQDPKELLQLDFRIRTLSTMYREARELGVLTERYYERGYRRNAYYTI